MSGPVIPAPICAVCRREVDEMTLVQNPAENRLEVTVSCHGSSQTDYLYYRQLANLGPQAIIEPGVAFKHEVHQRMLAQAISEPGSLDRRPWETREEHSRRIRTLLELPSA